MKKIIKLPPRPPKPKQRDHLAIIAAWTPEQRRLYCEETQQMFPEQIKEFHRERNKRIGWYRRIMEMIFSR